MNRTPTLILDGIRAKRGRFYRLRQFLESECGAAGVFNYNTSAFIPFETLAKQLCQHLQTYDELTEWRSTPQLSLSTQNSALRT